MERGHGIERGWPGDSRPVGRWPRRLHQRRPVARRQGDCARRSTRAAPVAARARRCAAPAARTAPAY
ncbi:hypothetical protein A8H31_12450 [Burkholderia thailandensis]|nr:hypothetical protein A8H31_12450 [Burkholderia thailandensis]NOK45015.1 hypothetical protein [Burkholderia thailandensis]NOK56114.1 hypothetical protein [Burkholderia thailandensis]PNE73076.1 hypothetical protein A8H38_09870 [Burkholderia thailandensis]PNE85130.1 hypothetical protein A8H34_06550 [Burkholderia thailandensis]